MIDTHSIYVQYNVLVLLLNYYSVVLFYTFLLVYLRLLIELGFTLNLIGKYYRIESIL